MTKGSRVEISYKCDFCHREFISHKRRASPRLCKNCAEIARVVRKWAKDEEWPNEALEPGPKQEK